MSIRAMTRLRSSIRAKQTRQHSSIRAKPNKMAVFAGAALLYRSVRSKNGLIPCGIGVSWWWAPRASSGAMWCGNSPRPAPRSPRFAAIADEAGYLRPMGDVGQIVPIGCDMADASRLRPILAGSGGGDQRHRNPVRARPAAFPKVHRGRPGSPGEAGRRSGRQGLRPCLGHRTPIPLRLRPMRAARRRARKLVRQAFPSAVILRPSLIFGPEDAFFNRFAAIARFSPALPLIGGGATRFQPVYVGDVADAVLAALEHPESPGKTYELGGPQIFTLKELFALLLKEIGRKRLLLPMPFGLAYLFAAFHDLLPLPQPLITRDQVRMLKSDAVSRPARRGSNRLGSIPPRWSRSWRAISRGSGGPTSQPPSRPEANFSCRAAVGAWRPFHAAPLSHAARGGCMMAPCGCFITSGSRPARARCAWRSPKRASNSR